MMFTPLSWNVAKHPLDPTTSRHKDHFSLLKFETSELE